MDRATQPSQALSEQASTAPKRRIDAAHQGSSGPKPHIQWDRQQEHDQVLAEMIAGKFEENISTQAESLAAHLNKRQAELDRREQQLNQWMVEIDAQIRAIKLANQPDFEELPISDVNDENSVSSQRLDRFANIERQMKKMVENSKPSPVPPPKFARRKSMANHAARTANPVTAAASDSGKQNQPSNPEPSESAQSNEVNPATIKMLTENATRIRMRGEQIEMAYAEIEVLYEEMVEQHSAMTKILKLLEESDLENATVNFDATRQTLARMNVNLKRLGANCFTSPIARAA